MLSFVFYLLKVIACSGVLFGYYWFFLRNKIFHSYNRFYLLAIIVLSLSLPMMKINVWHKAEEQPTNVIRMLQVVNSSDKYMDEVILYSQYKHISAEQLLSFIYILVCAVFFFLLLQVLYKIWRLLKTHPATSIENIHFIRTNAKGTPFSFLRFIFWNDAIDIETKTGRQVFKHEVAHVQEKHSYDKLFLNIVLILCWCNPFFWFIRKELNMIHEFIADKKAVEDGDTADFAAMILQATYPQYRFPIANNFFYSPIKRRLLMLTKQHKTKVNYISRLLVLPLAVIVFAAFSMKAKTYSGLANTKALTVVIDAGHGGTDDGARSTIDGKTLEKNMSLLIAQKIKVLNTNRNINIILTRETDIYQSPKEKAAFAEKMKADLFISIHLSSAPAGSKSSGLEVFVSKEESVHNTASKLFASSIINTFQNNYTLAVSPNPSTVRNIQALKQSACPAILIEAGYMSNEKDIAYLKTENGIETFVKNVLSALNDYAGQQPKLIKQETSDSVSISATKYYEDGKKNPLFILAGKEISKEEFQVLSDREAIDHCDVITGKAAIEKYGDKAKDGVFEIVLKKNSPDYKTVLSKINEDIYINAFQTTDRTTAKTARKYINEYASLPNNSPLYILNGKEVSSLRGYNISAENIENVRVLKPGTAMPTYGDKAVNGAIIINTVKDPLPKNALIVFDEKEYYGKVLQEVMATNDFREIEYVEIMEKDKAVKIYGNQAKDGAIIIRSKPSTQGPTVIIPGINGHKIHVNQLKNIKEVKCSLGGYTILSGTVYFSGVGFPDVILAPLTGESLKNLEGFLSKVKAGSVITFDNVKVKNSNGELMTIKGSTFDFYDKDEDLGVVYNHNRIFTKVEVEPDFPGGKDAWATYLRKNLNAAMPVDEGWKPGTYKIVVQFVVDENGIVSDVKTDDHPKSRTALQCIDLIKNGPAWLPAYQNGKKVRAYKKQPITFVVSEG